jgi:hypothetical protein
MLRNFEPRARLSTILFISSSAALKGVLATHDTLNDLMKVRDFRLPGETTEAADQRYWHT